MIKRLKYSTIRTNHVVTKTANKKIMHNYNGFEPVSLRKTLIAPITYEICTHQVTMDGLTDMSQSDPSRLHWYNEWWPATGRSTSALLFRQTNILIWQTRHLHTHIPQLSCNILVAHVEERGTLLTPRIIFPRLPPQLLTTHTRDGCLCSVPSILEQQPREGSQSDTEQPRIHEQRVAPNVCVHDTRIHRIRCHAVYVVVVESSRQLTHEQQVGEFAVAVRPYAAVTASLVVEVGEVEVAEGTYGGGDGDNAGIVVRRSQQREKEKGECEVAEVVHTWVRYINKSFKE